MIFGISFSHLIIFMLFGNVAHAPIVDVQFQPPEYEVPELSTSTPTSTIENGILENDNSLDVRNS